MRRDRRFGRDLHVQRDVLSESKRLDQRGGNGDEQRTLEPGRNETHRNGPIGTKGSQVSENFPVSSGEL